MSSIHKRSLKTLPKSHGRIRHSKTNQKALNLQKLDQLNRADAKLVWSQGKKNTEEEGAKKRQALWEE